MCFSVFLHFFLLYHFSSHFVSPFVPFAAPNPWQPLAHTRQEKKRKADEAAEEPAPKEVKVVPPQAGQWDGEISNLIMLFTGWCPPVISWFINPSNYSYICHKP